MTRPFSPIVLLFGALSLFVSPVEARQDGPPNFVVIFCDDLGY